MNSIHQTRSPLTQTQKRDMLDSRVSLFVLILITVLAFLSQSVTFHTVLATTLFLAILLSGVSIAKLRVLFTGLGFIVLISFLFHQFFGPGRGEVVFNLGPLAIHKETLQTTLFYSLRLAAFTLSIFLLILNSSPASLAQAVVRIIQPLRKLRVPVNDVWLASYVALRFTPILSQELVLIRNAQRMRGMPATTSIRTNANSTIATLKPLMLRSLSRVDTVSESLALRGFDSYRQRTLYNSSTFRRREWITLAACTIYLGALYLLTN